MTFAQWDRLLLRRICDQYQAIQKAASSASRRGPLRRLQRSPLGDPDLPDPAQCDSCKRALASLSSVDGQGGDGLAEPVQPIELSKNGPEPRAYMTQIGRTSIWP